MDKDKIKQELRMFALDLQRGDIKGRGREVLEKLIEHCANNIINETNKGFNLKDY